MRSMRALELLTDAKGMAVPSKRITISTVGLVPQILRMADERRRYRLAISLHAATDELRSKLMPVNRRFPLEPLMRAVRHHIETRRAAGHVRVHPDRRDQRHHA